MRIRLCKAEKDCVVKGRNEFQQIQEDFANAVKATMQRKEKKESWQDTRREESQSGKQTAKGTWRFHFRLLNLDTVTYGTGMDAGISAIIGNHHIALKNGMTLVCSFQAGGRREGSRACLAVDHVAF